MTIEEIGYNPKCKSSEMIDTHMLTFSMKISPLILHQNIKKDLGSEQITTRLKVLNYA